MHRLILGLIVIFLAAAIGMSLAKSAKADTYTVEWEPATEREDGSAITGSSTYEVYVNDDKAYSGPDLSYKFDVEYGQTACIAVYQLEGQIRSLARTRCYTVFASPPLAPRFVGPQ